MTPTLSSLVSHVHMFAVNLLSRIGSVPPRAYALAFSVFFSPFSSYTWRSPPRPTPPFLPAKTTLDGTRHGTVHLYVYDSDRLFLVPLCPPARLSYTTRNTHASTHTTHTWPLRFTTNPACYHLFTSFLTLALAPLLSRIYLVLSIYLSNTLLLSFISFSSLSLRRVAR